MILGVAYYPEHWPEERWPVDAAMMGELGLQVVRLAEFAWSRLEPRQGQYDWAWLDRAIDVFSQAGLQIVLGTPTAAPPAWLSRSYPETLPVDEQGHIRQFGSRRHYCPNSPLYRQLSVGIAAALAKRYAGLQEVIGWQIDNEFGGGRTARCYCPRCAEAFRAWLRQRYGLLEALNQAWGAVFWSQEYYDWEQIELPAGTVAAPNPSQVLDYYRFASDSFATYQKLQIEALRQRIPLGADGRPRQWITHNFMGLFQDLDQFDLAADLDFASWDSYPTGNPDRWRVLLYPPGVDSGQNDVLFAYDAGDPYITAMAHDLTRSLKRGPFWVMEQQCGHVNWGMYNSGVRPGTTRLWTWHALASGASAVIYFRWRACLYAQEQYHSGLLQHDATPGVGYADLQALQAEAELLRDVAAQPFEPARTALLFDFADLWALQIQPHRKDFHYLRHLFVFYQALQELGLAVDLAQPGSDLSSYRLVVAPSLHLADEGLVAHLEEYVRRGGKLLLGVRSGFKTPSNRVTDQPLPGALRSLSGALVKRWEALPPGIGYRLASRAPGLEGTAQVWAEWLQPEAGAGTQELAAYQDGPYTGGAALTGRHLGEGAVFSLGFYPTPQQAKALMIHLSEQAGLEPNRTLPRGVIARRRGGNWLLLNFCEQEQQVMIGGQVVQLEGRGVHLVKSQPVDQAGATNSGSVRAEKI